MLTLNSVKTWGHSLRAWVQQQIVSLAANNKEGAGSVAVIRRCSKVEQGRVRLYFQAILFGNNPFDLERFGPVYASDAQLPDGLCPSSVNTAADFRFYVLDGVYYPSAHETAQVWQDRGIPVALTSGNRSPLRSNR